MKLSTVVPASELSKLQVKKKLLKGMVGVSLRFLQSTFGSQIMLEIPPYLQSSKLETLKMIHIANRLRELGIIKYATKKHKDSDEPLLHQYYALTNGNFHGYGADFFSEEKAFWKSLAKATERHFWLNSKEFYKNKLTFSSYRNISKKALDIFSLAGISQERKKGDEASEFDSDTIFGWIPATSISSGQEICCPAQTASFLYESEASQTDNDADSDKDKKQPETKKEPVLRKADMAGLATGKTLDEAVLNGFLEIIEKDAFMITYLNRISAPRINLEHLRFQDGDIRNILNKLERYRLEASFMDLPTDFPLSVVACTIMDRTGKGPAFSIGVSADFDLKRAIINSASQALSMRTSIKNVHASGSTAPKSEYQERILHWSQEKNLADIEFLTNGSEIEINLNDNRNFFLKNRKAESDSNTYQSGVRKLSDAFKKMGYEACYVKMSTKEVEKLGFYCIKAISPDLQSANTSKKKPYLESERLKNVPEKLGYKPATELNQEIHPLI